MLLSRDALTRLMCYLCLSGICAAAQVHAQVQAEAKTPSRSFSLKTIPLNHPANGDLVHLDGQLAVSGHNSETRWLSLVDLTRFNALALPIPENAQFFAAAQLAGYADKQLLLLTTEGVSRFDAQAQGFTPLFTSPSLYPVADTKRLWQLDIVTDVNDDGLSDLLIPDFVYYHLYVQNAQGQFTHFRLPVESQSNLWGKEPNFLPRKAYVFDFTLNGKMDIVFVRDDTLVVFAQNEDGGFSDSAGVFKPGPVISSDKHANVRTNEGRDFSQLVINRVHDLQDLDGDGLTDLVIRREAFSSAVEQNYSYRIHYGRRSDTGLVFEPEPDTQINTQGIQFESVFADINGDGRKDFYTPSASFGVGTIIRALVSGSANLDIQFYLMDEARNFASKPDHNQRASANVSITRGSVDLPLFQVARLDSSGHKQLIIGENQERLRIYPPGNSRLFSNTSLRFSTPLPKDGRRVKVIDVDNNGLDDLVLPFDAQDGEATRNQVRVLLSQPLHK